MLSTTSPHEWRRSPAQHAVVWASAVYFCRASKTILITAVQNDPGGSRTRDLRIKSPLLYQLSYRVWRRWSIFCHAIFRDDIQNRLAATVTHSLFRAAIAGVILISTFPVSPAIALH